MIKKSNFVGLKHQTVAEVEDRAMGASLRNDIGRPVDVPTDHATDVIGLILARQSTLSKAQRRIAQAVLTQPQLFVEKPIEELAPWLGVSMPTVTRFSRAFACDGLRELKLRIMGSMRVGLRYLEPASPPTTIADAVSRVIMRAHHAITTAQRRNGRLIWPCWNGQQKSSAEAVCCTFLAVAAYQVG